MLVARNRLAQRVTCQEWAPGEPADSAHEQLDGLAAEIWRGIRAEPIGSDT